MRGYASRRLLAAFLLVIGVLIAPPQALGSEPGPAKSSTGPADGRYISSEDAIPGQYIVGLTSAVTEVRATSRDLAASHDGTILYRYEDAIDGFAVEMTKREAIELSRAPRWRM